MDNNSQILTHSAEETKEVGRDFANRLKGGEILALVGDLGSGKTTFVQGLAERLGIKDKIISPTFILQRQYETKSKTQISNVKYFYKGTFKLKRLYHIDLYRLENNIDDEIAKIGLKDVWEKTENLVVIEWADKARLLIPESATWITFESQADNKRKIIVS